jgi:hypothetical protein
LVEAEANVDLKDKHGRTALHYARAKNHAACITALEAAQAQALRAQAPAPQAAAQEEGTGQVSGVTTDPPAATQAPAAAPADVSPGEGDAKKNSTGK